MEPRAAVQINKQDTFRLIQQFLVSQGLQGIAKQIEQETNVAMESQHIELFRSCILKGQFESLFRIEPPKEEIGSQEGLPEAVQQLSLFDKVTASISPDNKQILTYFIFEQQYLELMQSGKQIEAIQLLQKELVPRSPFGKDKTNLFKLASMIMQKPEQQFNLAA